MEEIETSCLKFTLCGSTKKDTYGGAKSVKSSVAKMRKNPWGFGSRANQNLRGFALS